MSVSLSKVLDVKNWFVGQHIPISTDWIEACIDFVVQERTGQNLSVQQVKNCVYEQWLAADLEEIGTSALPLDLATVQKITLNGCFSLQVNGIRDVSKPAYTQLKQLEGNVNENAEVSATPSATLSDWEKKPTRMLVLNLTDGRTHIQGMEYKPISFLSPNLPPGVKVLIKGPIDCRFGLLMLTPDKIKVLGGEVENNLRKFSREALLREALQLPSNDDENTPANSIQNEVVEARPLRNLSEQNTYVQTHSNPTRLQSSTSNGRVLTEVKHLDVCENVQKSFRPEINYLDNFESDDDDFAQGLDYSALDEIERQNSQKIIQNDNDDVCREWQEDDDVMQELMAFQQTEPEIEFPFQVSKATTSNTTKNILHKDSQNDKPFTYLSVALKHNRPGSLVTIKGFIMNVVSKLECDSDEGWTLIVQINDGTASIDANLHNQVLEEFIGISAPNMVKMKAQASENIEIGRKIMEAISNCKLKLQNLNCLMDVKFSTCLRPCIVKCYPFNQSHIQQLIERVRINI